MNSVLSDLDRYWFGRGSPVAFGVFRILAASVVLLNLIVLSLQWSAWFSESGFLTADMARRWQGPNPTIAGFSIPRIDLLGNVTDSRLSIAVFAVTMLVALFTVLGLWTRVSSILLALGLVSLHQRNPLILHGGDTVMRICVLYLAIGPSGAACSMDRVIALRRGGAPAEPPKVSLWPQRLVCYNLALIYFTTVWLKYFGDLWRDGTATWYTARLDELHRFSVPAFVNDLPMVRVTTYGTLLVEFSLATLVFFRPLRKYVLIGGLLLHGFIEYSMNVPFFGFAICSMYICFYDGEEVSAWMHRMRARFPGKLWVSSSRGS